MEQLLIVEDDIGLNQGLVNGKKQVPFCSI